MIGDPHGERPPFPERRAKRRRKMAVLVDPVITWVDIEVDEGVDIYGAALDKAEEHIPSVYAGNAATIAIVPGDCIVEYNRGWISHREREVVELQEPESRWSPDEPHPFQGVLLGVADRPCTLCHLADIHPIHDQSKIR